MAVTALAERKATCPPAALPMGIFASSLLLDRFCPEQNQGRENTQILKSDAVLAGIADKFRKVRKLDVLGEISRAKDASEVYEKWYLDCARAIKPNKYTARDIEMFSLGMEPLHDGRSLSLPIFLSALINTSKDEEFTIFTHTVGAPIDALGYRNEKRLKIIGNVGVSAGMNMKTGVLEIFGNSSGALGHQMEGGAIILTGDCGNSPGFFMKGGKITINGNALETVGAWAEGGLITVNGNSGSNAGYYMNGGKIIINGDAGENVGAYADGGEITVNGYIESLDMNIIRPSKITISQTYDGITRTIVENGRKINDIIY